eukprot:6103439-Pleurochrysis_carterae.AAC.1
MVSVCTLWSLAARCYHDITSAHLEKDATRSSKRLHTKSVRLTGEVFRLCENDHRVIIACIADEDKGTFIMKSI